jgi:glycerate 2-kinase
MTSPTRSLTQSARAIAAHALAAVDIRAAVRQQVRFAGDSLHLASAAEPVSELDEVLILAIGKAAPAMWRAAVESLQTTGLRTRAIVITNQPPPPDASNATWLDGAHPLPDQRSLEAAHAILNALALVTPRSAVLFLISGGASAMLEQPLDPTLSIADMAAFHRALIGSGLPIAAMNVLRKHASAVKGGRLAVAAAAARIQATLLVSDVPAGTPDAIGSGPSLPDPSTLADCRALLPQLQSTLLPPLATFFASPLCVETPKPTDAVFTRAAWHVVASSEHLADAAAHAGRAAGFHVEIDNTCDEWEYTAASTYLLDRGLALAALHPRCCLISVGEVGVALPPTLGEGGRNQQWCLWTARELARRGARGVVLSVGSDGVDGNSKLAGAICDEMTVERAVNLPQSVDEALVNFNCAPLLRRLGAAIETGPTGSNLRDLRLLLFESPSGSQSTPPRAVTVKAVLGQRTG